MSRYNLVPRIVTKEMKDAADGYCWTSESRDSTIQKMWNAMLDASSCIDLSDNKQNALYEMGKRDGIAEIQNKIKEKLKIMEV